MTECPCIIREATSNDTPFIVHSWMQSNKPMSIVARKPRQCNFNAMTKHEVEARTRRLEEEKNTYTPSRMDEDVYWTEQSLLIARILHRENTRTLVAHYADDPDLLLGFAVYEHDDPPVLHYVYVKDTWRKLRVAARLLFDVKSDAGAGPYVVTHWTRRAPVVQSILGHEVTYNPYRSFQHEEFDTVEPRGAARASVHTRRDEGLLLHPGQG